MKYLWVLLVVILCTAGYFVAKHNGSTGLSLVLDSAIYGLGIPIVGGLMVFVMRNGGPK